ncbi:MAG TPA: hypothetical protein VE569_06260 [Acidimicrobiia bacterium]|nr:hypothetical protein [Acidimicrobiia bacterium]
MPRAFGTVIVFVTAFVVFMGILGFFAGIALAFGTTEESFVNLGFELDGALLSVVGAAVVAIALYFVRVVGRLSR